MNNLDFLTKELADEFLVVKPNVQTIKYFKLFKTECARFVTAQGVGFSGQKYKVTDKETGKHKFILHVGISRQNPKDKVFDRATCIEVAKEKSLINPIITMEVSKEFNRKNFLQLVNLYYDTMDLSIIKTTNEEKIIKLEENYNK